MAPGVEVKGINRMERLIHQANLTSLDKPLQSRQRCPPLYEEDHLRSGKAQTHGPMLRAVTKQLNSASASLISEVCRYQEGIECFHVSVLS